VFVAQEASQTLRGNHAAKSTTKYENFSHLSYFLSAVFASSCARRQRTTSTEHFA
jgi:hypothetical protein